MIYPVKNIPYIDALFFASGSCTQAGLNTVDINKLTLYQQLITYIFPMLTNPIVVHSGVVFLRLYWFERRFKGIKENSKLQSKMRRTATMAQYESNQNNSNNNRARHNADIELGPMLNSVKTPSFRHYNHNNNDDSSKDKSSSSGSNSSGGGGGDDDDNSPPPPAPPQSKDIKFGELPHPPRERSTSVAPRDVYMSLNMMQRDRTENNDDEISSGPALVIKSPRAMDEEHELQEWLASRPGSINSEALTDDAGDETTTVNGGEGLQRSQSVDASSSGTQMIPGGLKFSKRAHTVEGVVSGNGTGDDDDDDNISVMESIDRKSTKDDGDWGKVSFAVGGNNHNKNSNKRNSYNNNNNRKKASYGRRKIRGYRRRMYPGGEFKRSKTFEQMLSSARQRLIENRNDTETDDGASTSGGGGRLQHAMSANYLSWQPTVGRNSQFVDLTEEQKEELGGVEYRALKLLSRILVVYFLGLHLLAAIMMTPWINLTTKYHDYVRSVGVNPTWWAFYTAESSFNDVGFTLTPDSMSSFAHAAYVLLSMSFFIVVGNTGFPCLLRLAIWGFFQLTPRFGRTHESLAFLLDHPRRCFTLLFPAYATWWLFAILVILNSVDLIFFIILDLGNDEVTDLPVAYRIISGLYEAFATRTAGFSVISPRALHAGIQVSYMVMMYISVMPIAISIRRTNVYEEQSLGIYNDNEDEETEESNSDDDGDKKKEEPSYVSNHLRRQLSFDLWYIVLGLFIITIAEGRRVGNTTETSFDTFSILFEVVSAYGTVGLSMGYPNVNTSFCGQFTVVSKLVIIAMMVRGRHRGLPYALDRAIMLPNEKLKKTDTMQENNTRNRLRRSSTNASQDTNRVSNVRTNTSISSTGRNNNGLHNRMRRLSVSSVLSATPAQAHRAKQR